MDTSTCRFCGMSLSELYDRTTGVTCYCESCGAVFSLRRNAGSGQEELCCTSPPRGSSIDQLIDIMIVTR